MSEGFVPVDGGIASRSGFPSRHPLLWWLALFLGIFPISFRQVGVSDAWWHVALGRWLVEKRSLPDLGQFYFSPFDAGSLGSELRWEWLGDIAFYLCYSVAGAAGLQWLVIGCVMAGLGFLAMLADAPVAPSKGNGHRNRWRALRRLRRFLKGDGTPVPPGSPGGREREKSHGQKTSAPAHLAAGKVECLAGKATGAKRSNAHATGGIAAPRGPWLLLLLVVVCLGTYQLQLARNSVFSLALYPAVLWLGLRRTGPPTWSEYATIGGVLVLWSCLHGVVSWDG
ncbi:MAG: hypothetical protein WC003_13345 [Terrimicrobiaceae bacterium]